MYCGVWWVYNKRRIMDMDWFLANSFVTLVQKTFTDAVKTISWCSFRTASINIASKNNIYVDEVRKTAL